MKIAIMQPYFSPYIGYFQLINAVDEFVIYDNIEFTKKGWINRNRILFNGNDLFITLPLKNDSDFLQIRDRFLSDNWVVDRKKILNKITESYRKAPLFDKAYYVIEKCLLYDDKNLFNFNYNSVKIFMEYLHIDTKLTISSSIPINHELKSQDKVIAICLQQNADIYINPIGGIELYDKKVFNNYNIQLEFLHSKSISYKQFKNDFIPWLSIIDVIMFNEVETISKFLNEDYFL